MHVEKLAGEVFGVAFVVVFAVDVFVNFVSVVIVVIVVIVVAFVVCAVVSLTNKNKTKNIMSVPTFTPFEARKLLPTFSFF